MARLEEVRRADVEDDEASRVDVGEPRRELRRIEGRKSVGHVLGPQTAARDGDQRPADRKSSSPCNQRRKRRKLRASPTAATRHGRAGKGWKDDQESTSEIPTTTDNCSPTKHR